MNSRTLRKNYLLALSAVVYLVTLLLLLSELDRQYYQTWFDAGASDLAERCRQRKNEILATHTPEPLPADVLREIDRIVAAAGRELVGDGAAGRENP